MATPRNDSYSAATGADIYGGRVPVKFANVTNFSNDAFVPTATAGQPLALYLHGSSANPLQVGAFWSAEMLEDLNYAPGGNDMMYWAAQTRSGGGVTWTEIRPRDRNPDNNDGSVNLNSYHMGFTDDSSSPKLMNLLAERRYDELLAWAERQYPQCSTTKRILTGDSVGAWATLTYGIRRPDKFAALYPSRPRVRWNGNGSPFITLPDVQSGQIEWNTSTLVPNRSVVDGGGSMLDHCNIIAYVSNTANRIPWIGYIIGKNDGYMQWQDHVDFIAALRTAKRGFAVSWNLGDHSTPPSWSTITDSYYTGLFEIGVGYPLLTNNSGDSDPATVDVGGINLGFKWRNVVETAGGWSCEITNILGARTVDVEPISDIFTDTVTPQTINIPSANTWVAVSF